MKTLCLSIFSIILFCSVSFAADAPAQFVFHWEDIESVRLISYPDNQIGVEVNPKLDRSFDFYKATEANMKHPMAIYFGDTKVMEAVIQAKFNKFTVTVPDLEAAFALVRMLQAKTSK